MCFNLNLVKSYICLYVSKAVKIGIFGEFFEKLANEIL